MTHRGWGQCEAMVSVMRWSYYTVVYGQCGVRLLLEKSNYAIVEGGVFFHSK